MSDDQHLHADSVQIAVPARQQDEPEQSDHTPDDDDDTPLSMLERMVASIGAWASDLAEHFTPPSGPFFAADGRPAPDDLTRPLVIPEDLLCDLDAPPCV